MIGWEAILTGALDASIAYGMIIGLAALGEMVSERAGVLNIGLEGVLLLGAFGGFSLAWFTEQPWLGLAGGALCGALLGLIMSVWSISFKTEQVINGILLNMIAAGLTTMLSQKWFMKLAEPPRLSGFAPIAIPLLSQVPVLGQAIFSRSWPSYLAIVLVFATSWVLFKTRTGLIFRACGEAPEAVDFSGVNVFIYRYLAVIAGCSFAGLAGALLTVDQLKFFAPSVTAGRGWIALAIVIVGGWRPWGCVLAALLFGVTDMLQFQFQGNSTVIPYEFLLALPYVIAIVALALRRQALRAPRALGVPFRK